MLSKVFCILVLGISATRTVAQCNTCYDGSTPEAAAEGCEEVIDAVATLDASSAECQSKQLEAYQRRCCKSAPSHCTVCPDGAAFNAETAVPNPNSGRADITCADMNSELKFLDVIPIPGVSIPGVCSETLLQRSATWCGCPNTSRQCNLCADGSAPANPDRVEKILYGWDCRFFEFVSSMYSADECPKLSADGDILTIDAAAFCGCPNTTPPTVCSLCGEGEIIKTETDLGQFTCGDLALSVSYINNRQTCVSEKNILRHLGEENFVEKCCFDPSSISGANSSVHGLAFALAFLALVY